MKRLFWYALPNLVLNGIIPYVNFENPLAVALFQGEYCFARFILPMALFVPFAITVDCMKKTNAFMLSIELSDVRGKEGMDLRVFLKYGICNGLLTFAVLLLMLCIVQGLIPSNYVFNGLLLSAFNGITACLLAVYFTLWSIRKLEKLVND